MKSKSNFEKFFFFNYESIYLRLKKSSEILAKYQNTQIQRQSFKFDPNFLKLLVDSFKVFKKSNASSQENNEDICILAIHAYSCILNEYNSTQNNAFNSNMNDSLMKAIKLPIIDLIFELLQNEEPKNGEYIDLILLDQENVLFNQEKKSIREENFQKNLNLDRVNKLLFYNRNQVACKCISMIVNILHLALPDKRQIDLSIILDRLLNALYNDSNNFYLKFGIIKSYLTMLNECMDKAALKIVLVSKRFIFCLLEELRLACFALVENRKSLLHEFALLVLILLKNLLENSQSVNVRL